MAKWIFIFFCLFTCATAQAQGDMLVIKKNDISFKTFIAGSYVSFITTNGEAISTNISSIKNDSIFFKELVVRQVMTQFGVPRLDTMASLLRGIHYSEIAAIPKPRKFSELTVAKLLMVGGAGYLAVNMINSIYLRYPPFAKDNLSNILPAVGAFATGFAVNKLSSRYYIIGKKFSMHYVKLGTP